MRERERERERERFRIHVRFAVKSGIHADGVYFAHVMMLRFIGVFVK